MAKLNMVEALNMALRGEMERDPGSLFLAKTSGRKGGSFVLRRTSTKIWSRPGGRYPVGRIGDRWSCLGNGGERLRPVAEIQFEGFLYPCLDQINNHIGRMRNDREEGSPALSHPLSLRWGHPCTRASLDSPEAILAHIPGIKVVIPSTPYEAKGLLLSCIRDPDPVLFMNPSVFTAPFGGCSGRRLRHSSGEAKVVQEGKDVTVIAYGAMVREAVSASEKLER